MKRYRGLATAVWGGQRGMRLLVQDPDAGPGEVLLSRRDVERVLLEVAVQDPGMLDQARHAAAPAGAGS